MTSEMTKQEAEKLFSQAKNQHRELRYVPKIFQQNLEYMRYKIQKDMKSFNFLSICGGDRNSFYAESYFQRAFSSQTFQQKVQYYSKVIDYSSRCINDDASISTELLKATNQDVIRIRISVSKGFRQENVQIELKNFKVISKDNFNIDLRNYILRKSKKKDRKYYVLESIKKLNPQTIRFCFQNQQDSLKYFPTIQKRVDLALKQSIFRVISEVKEQRGVKIGSNSSEYKMTVKNIMDQERKGKKQSMKEDFQQPAESPISLNLDYVPVNKKAGSICEEMLKSKESQIFDDELEDMVQKQNEQMQEEQQRQQKAQKQKYYKNILRIVLPNFQISDLNSLLHFRTVYRSDNQHFFIYQSMLNHRSFKMEMNLHLSPEIVCQALSNMRYQKTWHPEIAQAQIKMKISSENSLIAYQKHRALDEWYRQRDFVHLLHLFKLKDFYYLIGKSIQNTNFIPFQSIIRGTIHEVIWQIKRNNKNGSDVFMAIDMQQDGLLNNKQQFQLTVRYIKGFEAMAEYYQSPQHREKLTKNLGMHWEISQVQLEQDQHASIDRPISYRTCDFENNESSEFQDDETVFYTIPDENEDFDFDSEEEVKPQIGKDELVKNDILKIDSVINSHEAEIMKLNDDGLIILPKDYIRKRFPLLPKDVKPNPRVATEYESQNLVLKNDWKLLEKGNFRLINKQKIAAQDNVFKYIMTTLKNNLFSGKGITNISLPVEIFNVDSWLQRLCGAYSFGPNFLQKGSKCKDPVERMKYVIAFGLSTTILSLEAEKPFNPILGETYQGYIAGCPVYGEQISHHPPISALYMIGRGYKINACLESTVKIHMNSGEGINVGWNNIVFDDGSTVSYCTPGGQLTGLSFGQRGYNNKGKGYYIDHKNDLYCELKFDDQSGYFSKNKWKFGDQVQGQLVKVKSSFTKQFLAMAPKRVSPSKNDILEKYFSIGGRWSMELLIDGKVIYDINNDIPEKLVDQIYPLNSNSNYREDMFYRKQNDLSRSQIEKERLENVQRRDRKLRQKVHGKKGH